MGEAVRDGFVLAFDFGGTKMAIATFTRDGQEILNRTEISTVKCDNGHEALAQAIDAGEELVRQTQAEIHAELSAIGIATMGITRPDRVDIAPNVPGWSELRIEESFRNAFPGTPIRIANDVKAAALAEVRRGSLKDKDVGLFVNFGTGVAMAYTFHGNIIEGHHGASGEIAYCMRTSQEATGVKDDVAPLEAFVGGRSIGERATEHFGVPMTAGDLLRKARTDSLAMEFVNKILEEMSFHLTNIIIGWDPETVVLSGGLMGASDLILPAIISKVNQFVPFPPEIVRTHFLRDAGLYGAAELALDARSLHSEQLVALH